MIQNKIGDEQIKENLTAFFNKKTPDVWEKISMEITEIKITESINKDDKNKEGINKSLWSLVTYLLTNRAVVILLIVLIIGLTGFATIQVYHLLNQNGDIVFEYGPSEDNEEEYLNFRERVEKIAGFDQLKEGEAVSVYFPGDVNQGEVHGRGLTLQKPYLFSDYNVLVEHVYDFIILDSTLNKIGLYHFEKASVYHQTAEGEEYYKKIRDALSAEPIPTEIVSKCIVLKEISSFSIFYKQLDKEIRFDMGETFGKIFSTGKTVGMLAVYR